MAMMRVMQATRMEREGRWPSEGFMRMGERAFLGLYARERNGWMAVSSDQIAGSDERKKITQRRRVRRDSPRTENQKRPAPVCRILVVLAVCRPVPAANVALAGTCQRFQISDASLGQLC